MSKLGDSHRSPLISPFQFLTRPPSGAPSPSYQLIPHIFPSYKCVGCYCVMKSLKKLTRQFRQQTHRSSSRTTLHESNLFCIILTNYRLSYDSPLPPGLRNRFIRSYPCVVAYVYYIVHLHCSIAVVCHHCMFRDPNALPAFN